MAASEALLTWGGFSGNPWFVEEEALLTWGSRWSGEQEEEQSMETMRARLQAMTCAVQAKDAALQELQRRLQAALKEVEQGRAEEAALRRRAEIAEAAEGALASQIGELEAEAYASITQSSKMQYDAFQQTIEKLGRGLQEARDDAGYWERRCKEVLAEVEQGRAREASLLGRAERAEAAEEALAAEMAEVEAEAYARITEGESHANVKSELDISLPEQPSQVGNSEILEPIERRYVAELERRLVAAERALAEVHAKLQVAEEKDRALEKEQVMRVKKKNDKGSEETVLALSLQELAGMVKLRLWSPSSLTLVSSA